MDTRPLTSHRVPNSNLLVFTVVILRGIVAYVNCPFGNTVGDDECPRRRRKVTQVHFGYPSVDFTTVLTQRQHVRVISPRPLSSSPRGIVANVNCPSDGFPREGGTIRVG